MIQQSRYPWKIKPGTATSSSVAVRPPEIVAQVPRVCLSPREAAASLGVSTGTLETLRRAGRGPPSLVLPGGRRRLYPVDLLIRWAADRAAADEEEDQGSDEG